MVTADTPEQLNPMPGYVMVIEEIAETTAGGILLPDQAQQKKQQKGKVIAVGAGEWNSDGRRNVPEVKVGDTVYFVKYAGCDFNCGAIKARIMKEKEILAIVVEAETVNTKENLE